MTEETNVITIDGKSYAQEDLSVTDIIEKLRLLNINVVNIISKRNRLEELFLDLTKEELV